MTVHLLIAFSVMATLAGIVGALRHRSAQPTPPAPAGPDGPLADWARTTHLTVVTVTGYVFSMSLAEIRESEFGSYRHWNVPSSITLWSDTDREAHELYRMGLGDTHERS